MQKNYAALHFVTVVDEEKISREYQKMVDAGFSPEEAALANEERMSRGSIPPVAMQRIVGVYAVLLQTPEGQPDENNTVVIRSFAAAGDNEGALVNFSFRVLSALAPSKANAPIIIAGNNGYALQILLSKANERTMAERSGIILRPGDNDFISSSYGKTLSLFLDNSDKFGINYTNKYSKVVFDPSEFDSQPSLPTHIPAKRMFESKDWDSILVMAKAGCEDVFVRSVNIIDNKNCIPLGDMKNGHRKEGERMFPVFPSPDAKSAFHVVTGEKHKAVVWKDVEKNALESRKPLVTTVHNGLTL